MGPWSAGGGEVAGRPPLRLGVGIGLGEVWGGVGRVAQLVEHMTETHASMRPRLVGWGKNAAKGINVARLQGFNEAPACWLGKDLIHDWPIHAVPDASMRPRPVGWGKMATIEIYGQLSVRLQ